MSVLDNFNRDEGPPLNATNWSDDFTNLKCTAASGHCFCNDLTQNRAIWKVGMGSSDVDVSITLSTAMLNDGEFVNLFYRLAAGALGDGYYVQFYHQGAKAAYLFKYLSGVPTQLAVDDSTVGNFANGDVLRVTVIGTLHTVYINGTPLPAITNFSDNSVPVGQYVGFASSAVAATVMQFDDFSGGIAGAILPVQDLMGQMSGM